MNQFVCICARLSELTVNFLINLVKIIVPSPRSLYRVKVTFVVITGFPANSFFKLHHISFILDRGHQQTHAHVSLFLSCDSPFF